MDNTLYRWVAYNWEDKNTYPRVSSVYFVKIEKWNAGAKLIYSTELGWMYDEKTVIQFGDTPSHYLVAVAEDNQQELWDKLAAELVEMGITEHIKQSSIAYLKTKYHLIPKQVK